MSTTHGGPVTLKPIEEIARFLKNQLPARFPESYALKPRFEAVAREGDIREGVVAFRDFLVLFCDRLISDGHLYAKAPKNPKSATDYPFLYQVTDLLVDIGYNGGLTGNGDALSIAQTPSFAATVDAQGNARKPRNPVSKRMECLRFLARCGFDFPGTDLNAKSLAISEARPLRVTYPDAPITLTGLRAMAIADMELRVRRYKNDENHDNLLRCDYRAIMAEETDVLDVLMDFLHPLPEGTQKLALELHRRYSDMGMTCVTLLSTFEAHFAYFYPKNSRRAMSPRDMYSLRVWEFALSTRHGYCLVIRAKNTDQYADVVERFPAPLRETIARGYGCDRKLRNEPCQGGCQGFRLPLQYALPDIGRDIETWLDHEVSFGIK